jgi:hypothetical protein
MCIVNKKRAFDTQMLVRVLTVESIEPDCIIRVQYHKLCLESNSVMNAAWHFYFDAIRHVMFKHLIF